MTLIIAALCIVPHTKKAPDQHTVEHPWATTSRKRPLLLSDHLTKVRIGSSLSQIAIIESSRKRPPPVSDHLSLTSRVVTYGRFLCIWFIGQIYDLNTTATGLTALTYERIREVISTFTGKQQTNLHMPLNMNRQNSDIVAGYQAESLRITALKYCLMLLRLGTKAITYNVRNELISQPLKALQKLLWRHDRYTLPTSK